MTTAAASIDHLLDTLSSLPLTARKMFGEYALYLNGKVVALVCDDQLFVKATPRSVAALPASPLAPPYPGAKGHLLVTDALDDPDPVIAALRSLAEDLPAPKPKKPKT
jgi:TfoX/Sxy family transcriptional regulator of competence genes